MVPALLLVDVAGQVASPLLQGRYRTQCTTLNPNPVVVTTNENQWEHAEGRIIRREVFGDLLEDEATRTATTAPWTKMCNALRIFFLRCTRQDLIYDELLTSAQLQCLVQPLRDLSRADVAFLHERKMQGKAAVSVAEYEELWKWLGAFTHGYRHNHVLRAMLLKGLIYGLLSKEDCLTLLERQAPGTFLIRNSEQSSTGEFALAFVNAHHLVKHHKIDPKKLRAPYGNLADYVRDKDQLTHLVKPYHQEGETTLDAPVVVKKLDAVTEFCSVAEKPRGQMDANYTEYIH